MTLMRAPEAGEPIQPASLSSQHIQPHLQPTKKALPTAAVIQIPTAVPQRQQHTQPDDRNDS